MKKSILGLVLGLFMFPLFARADLMGFLDGNMYDPATGQWQCFFLMDGNCYDLNENILTTRPTSTAETIIIPPATQTVQYVPVYIPSNLGSNLPPPVTPIPTPVVIPDPKVSVKYTHVGDNLTQFMIKSDQSISITSFKYNLVNNLKDGNLVINIGYFSDEYLYNGKFPLGYNQTDIYTLKTPISVPTYYTTLLIVGGDFYPDQFKFDFTITDVTYEFQGKTITVPVVF